jgi:hypothetical protein
MLALSLIVAAAMLPAPAEHALYRAEFVRATPGRLLELIDYVKAQLPAYESAGEARPFVLRHSQGDQWDLLLLLPLGDRVSDAFSADRIKKRESAGLEGSTRDRKWRELVAWHEDLYVNGPSLADVRKEFENAGLAHVEIFQALGGAYDALRREREMEAAFNRNIGRANLLLFERETAVGGAPWDMFTIDLYRDLKHYADATTAPTDRQDEAARAAGFASSAVIGPTMRTYIGTHHDTIASVVR